MKSKLIVIACLILVLSVVLVLPLSFASAEYVEDYLSDPNAIVTFNQGITQSYVHDYLLPYHVSTRITNLNYFINGHTYYARYDFTLTGTGILYIEIKNSNNGVYEYLQSSSVSFSNSKYFTANENYAYLHLWNSNNGNTSIMNFMLIDLTLMFNGNDNIPTLQQCNDLFAAEYYDYTQGRVMTMANFVNMTPYNNGYDAGYQQGLTNGYRNGFDTGYSGGLANGYSNGYSDMLASNEVINLVQPIPTDLISTTSVNGYTITNNNNGSYSITGNATNGSIDTILSSNILSGLGLDSTHYYFMVYNYDDLQKVKFRFDDHIQFGEFTFYLTNILSIDLIIPSGSGEVNTTLWFSAIDLSLIFTDEQINSLFNSDFSRLFTSKYYSYTTGTSISLSTLNAYQNGVNSVISTTDNVVASPSDFNNSATEFFYNDTTSGIYYGSSITIHSDENWITAQFAANVSSYSPNVKGAFALPLVNTLLAGNLVTISGYASNDRGAGADNQLFSIYAFNESQGFVKLADSSLIGTSYPQVRYVSFDFEVPFNISTIYFVFDNSHMYAFKDFVITQKIYNFQAQIKQSFKDGQKSVEDKYLPTGSAYQAIWQRGYNEGHDAPQYSFKDLITAAVDTPVKAFISLFDFDILGVNMKTFYLSIFTLCVIFVVLKMVI